MFERIFSGVPTAVEEPWFPHLAALELEESEHEFTVRVELPGFALEEIEVEVTPQYLLVRAHHEEPATIGTTEGRLDELARRVDLPPGIEMEKVTAVYRKGVLQVTLPRGQASVVRKVPVTL